MGKPQSKLKVTEDQIEGSDLPVPLSQEIKLSPQPAKSSLQISKAPPASQLKKKGKSGEESEKEKFEKGKELLEMVSESRNL